ncbi:magnesium chelatase subunit H [Chlorobaculum sp. 24CR]|uniref:magnesium chelatase subunit H n=1 Tax=Chlorobaculum sp. 24CR TaxID=2508878 RepID=UPI00100A71B1|nr:magnesium chelatase subunit H [Chlorobaculum sp. 24CR]RXK89427.1 magnesium chelatase subunit H [Chlorobaculum sp. 24CR]
MRFLFITMEPTNNSVLKSAAAELSREFSLDLDVSMFNLGLNHSRNTWEKLEREIPGADFIFGSMLFSEEIVRPLEALLETAACPVCMITSNPALINQTRVGKFSLQKNAEEEKQQGIFKQLASKLKPAHGSSESQRQLSLVRNVGKLMKHIPGKARDIHTFISAHQFWLNGSKENMRRFLCLLIDRYIPGYKGQLPQNDPIFYPDTALYHPDAGKPFSTTYELREWQRKNRPATGTGQVAILVMRATLLSENMLHIINLLRELESREVPCCIAYSGGLDFRPALEGFFDPASSESMPIDLVVNATGFSLVGGPAETRSAEAVSILKKIGVPCFNLIPLAFQPISHWRENNLGLTPLQTALSVAVPELDGAIEPHVFAGLEEGSDRTLPLESETRALADRVARLVRLRRKANADKKLAIVLFNFPPNLGNAGTAAFLDVFESLLRLMRKLKEEGYQIDLPASVDALRDKLLEGNRLVFGTDGNVAAHYPVEQYRKAFPGYERIEPFWGDAPGELLNDGSRFHILGAMFGNLFVGQQPSFGYERDPMRLLMAKDAAPNHAFAAFYSWLDHEFRADALLHFGTHGALEFMPGKQVGLSQECWPKRLIGALPHFYCYCVNNPSEGAIAKRRGLATLVSYMAPPLEHAGLYKGMRQLRELVGSWRSRPSSEALAEIRELAGTLDLDRADEAMGDENYITWLNNELYLIEERMIPLGLHVFGQPPTAESLVDNLALLVSHARPELDNRSLPELVCAGLKLDYDRLAERHEEAMELRESWQKVTSICHGAVKRFVGKLPATLPTGVSTATLFEGTLTVRMDEASAWLQKSANVKPRQLDKLWHFLNGILAALLENREIEAVTQALAGAYIPPSPGNDLVRNPSIVPTGRNIHSLDPYSIPTPFATKAGERSAEELLAQYKRETGELPESIALILWGTDNLKSDGEGVAQALALLGARTKTDELGKIGDVELIPLEKLGRPRIDIVVTVSGIFRDLLSHQVRLLDRAVRLAAVADEPESMNLIRKHVRQQASELGISEDDAAGRIYSNAPGSYGSNVNHLVESSTWEEEQQLADAFVNRKSFAFSPEGDWRESPEILRSALKNVTLTFQNIDSFEIGLSDIDHYYEYLGGVSKSVELLGGSKPKVMVGDTGGFGKGQKIRSLEKMVALEARTKLLNPKWYEAMIEHGYEGVREIEAHLTNTYGWSATASAVKNWTYQQFTETFLQDRDMLERMAALNPNATMAMTRRLLEASSRGFWEADEGTIEQLQELYEELETKIEGAHTPEA